MDTISPPFPSELVRADDKTVIVLGNGPSLRNVDLKRLSAYPTIGLNAAYRFWNKIDWRPTYYACLDEEVGLSHRDSIAELVKEGRIKSFLLRANLVDALGPLAADPAVINFESLRTEHPLLDPPAITTGSHAALWATVLGYRRIVIAGVDGRYVEIVPGAERRGGMALEIVRQAENPNYFFDDYQKTGDRFNIPNPRPNVHLGAWHDVALKLEEAGVEVLNAGAESAVGYFPFIDLDDFLASGSEVSPPREKAEPPPLLAGSPAKTSTAENGRDRLWRFLGAQKVTMLSGALLVTLIWLLTAIQIGFSVAGTAAITLGAGFAYSLFGLLLYTRFVMSREFDAVRLKLDSARARIKDLERRL